MNPIKSFLFLFLSILAFFQLLARIDRQCCKAAHGFCLHNIQGPPAVNPAWNTDSPTPHHILDQPFLYLGKGAQSFVFESADHEWIIKFYKFPAHLRKFDWLKHPFGDRFSPKNQAINQHNAMRFNRSFNSYVIAYRHLQEETGVSYIHLNPSPHAQKILTAYDRTGRRYDIPIGRLGYILQKKGTPFFTVFRATLEQESLPQAQQMIDSLFHLIVQRCCKGITDLDNMDNNNYGWKDGRAMNLDVGRFVFKEDVKTPAGYQQEVKRVTLVLRDLLEKEYPALLDYYDSALMRLASQ